MDQLITAPDEEWVTYIAKMWLLGDQLSEEITGEKMDGSINDLIRLQKIVDSNKISQESTQELQSLGIVFGKVLVNDTPHYDWWVVEDDYGKDACIRYKETSLIVFPQTMISKRIEDGILVNVLELYQDLKKDLERIQHENYSNDN